MQQQLRGHRMGKPSKQRVASTAPKVVADAWYYTMLVLNRTSPLITFCLSQYGYLDCETLARTSYESNMGSAQAWLELMHGATACAGLYKYTLGVPSQDKRLMYSLLLMVLTVNLVRVQGQHGGRASKAVKQPNTGW